MSTPFHPGQRWISESEPELGLGSVERVTSRTVVVKFAASGETREYARDNAPLRRVRFRAGDIIKHKDGANISVTSVTERNDLVFYRSAGGELCETDLSDAISFSKPEERLLAGQVDEPELFDLRVRALEHQHRRRRSAVRGFVGGRIDLIPHQLYIASEVSRRLIPRVLLADEVGLGKTIEACLILRRLLATGRVQRILILVPESLVHQWFVELLRRFNLWFHIFDEERCAAIESSNPEANPFLDDQLVLCSVGWLANNARRIEQAAAGTWDILVVDEAHHLGWSPEHVSPEYAIVESIARTTPGLLLLTATPEQVGVASHFARLRLLDPNRFHDLNAFLSEAEHYREVASLAEKVLSNRSLAPSEVATLVSMVGESERRQVEKFTSGDTSVREHLIGLLLDQHGTGRVMFRNTRSTIHGFPPRKAHLHALSGGGEDPELFDRLADEFSADTSQQDSAFTPEFSDDPRIAWLAELLRRLGSEKLLLICRTRKKAEAVESALRQLITVKMAVFHEGLPLVQRDRNAAWFADEEGARLLICSEIGSEGRNFQFAHHLVLFDLPLDPELLEQRIGRLDRIGQTSEIQVHVPFIVGTPQEVLARWYHEGFNSFEKNLHAGRALHEQFGARVRDLAQDFHETEGTSRPELDALIRATATARVDLTTRLEQGRDRLLELNSFRPEAAARIVEQIRSEDSDTTIDEFMLGVFDHYAIQVEQLGKRTYFLGSAGVFADNFPGLPAEGLAVTADRQRALSREDVQFLTWDHPIVTGALDLLLGSEKGNSSFAVWPDAKSPGLYMEAIFVIECVAPPSLHVDRFLPPVPVRVMVDYRGEDVSASLTSVAVARVLKKGEPYALLDNPDIREELLPALLQKAQAIAASKMPAAVNEAKQRMSAQLRDEISRLQDLRAVNRSIRPEEIQSLIQEQITLEQHLNQARLRLDAVRLIQRGPSRD